MRTIAIDPEGYFKLHGGIRLTDEKTGLDMLTNLRVEPTGVILLRQNNEDYAVEAFDKPYIVKQVDLSKSQLDLLMPYGFKEQAQLDSLCLDQWDRLHGLATNGVPFVLSHSAQADLFQQITEFTDDSMTLFGKVYPTPTYYQDKNQVGQSSYWRDRYQETASPGWNLEAPHPELKSILSQVKVHRSRVLVPGCGFGHDAALLAQAGHFVTAVDFSEEALEGAKKRYGHINNLEFVHGDVFHLNESFHAAFDLIFEHTCYCAIPPERRPELWRSYRRYLTEDGYLLAILFAVPKRLGPYFGGSEWEFERELSDHFRFLYWTRLHHSPPGRQGAELMIYAQKILK